MTGNYADARIESDLELTARLPRTLAGMAAGLISGDRADVIAGRTASLPDADAARADEILAPIAPGLRVDQLDRKAAALEMKLNPDGVKARKEHARRPGSGSRSAARTPATPASPAASSTRSTRWRRRPTSTRSPSGSATPAWSSGRCLRSGPAS